MSFERTCASSDTELQHRRQTVVRFAATNICSCSFPIWTVTADYREVELVGESAGGRGAGGEEGERRSGGVGGISFWAELDGEDGKEVQFWGGICCGGGWEFSALAG